MNAEQSERLAYLARIRSYYSKRAHRSRGEHSPCGPMGTAERLQAEQALQFERNWGAELNGLLTLAAREVTP